MHISADEGCTRCSCSKEDVLHVLRDCTAVRALWSRLISPSSERFFFSLPLGDWLMFGLSNKFQSACSHGDSLLFGYVAWAAWRHRNESIFRPDQIPFSLSFEHILRLQHQYKVAVGIKRCLDTCPFASNSELSWERPEAGWVKVNTDGAFSRQRHLSAAGGLIRDNNGTWIQGFTHSLEACSAWQAEMWAMLDGLELAWNLGYRKVELETDCLELVNLLLNLPGLAIEQHDEHLLYSIRSLLDRHWSIRLRHIMREGNSCADRLAKEGLASNTGILYLSTPSEGVQELLFYDILNVRHSSSASDSSLFSC